MSDETQPGAPERSARSNRRSRFWLRLGSIILLWAAIAYLVMPIWWRQFLHRHPGFDKIPNVTHTGSGIPGDPLNVALVGSKAEIMSIMVAAKWYPADPLTLKSCLEIAEATVLRRPYDTAPVSNLFLYGRKEDLAFEQPVGNDPRKRHHVRFWLSETKDEQSRPIWIGAAVYDEHVGISRTTGQITHVTAANVDAERDYLLGDLAKTGMLREQFAIDGFHQTRSGKNGGGDPWFTDGKLIVGVIGSKP